MCDTISSANSVALLNPLRYRGYVYDEETGLYYLQSRYYDPLTGRFLNADDMSLVKEISLLLTNLYVYCGNNSVNELDPAGNSWLYDYYTFQFLIYRSGCSKKCELYIKYTSSKFISAIRFKNLTVTASGKTYLSYKGTSWKYNWFSTARKNGQAYIDKFNVPLKINKVTVKIKTFHCYILGKDWLSFNPSLFSGSIRIK